MVSESIYQHLRGGVNVGWGVKEGGGSYEDSRPVAAQVVTNEVSWFLLQREAERNQRGAAGWGSIKGCGGESAV